MQNILVRQPADLTIQWAQHIVTRHSARTRVSRVKVDSVNIGTTTRLRVVVEHNAPDVLPKHWFVKVPSMAIRARMITALPRLLHKEVNFYRDLAHLVPLRLPPILAAQSQFGWGSTLVLTDITELGSVPGNPSDKLSIEQAALVIEQLAKFHAHFWNKAYLVRRHRWLAGPSRCVEDHLGTILAVPLMKHGLSLAGDMVPTTLRSAALSYARNRRHLMQVLAAGPKTLVHHDCHPGNLFWTQSQPGFLDWQLIRLGEGVGDIAYFLATALEPEYRRGHEKRLLELYMTTLAEHGVRGLDAGHLLHRYRAHLAYPFEAMILTLAIGGMMEPDSNRELIRRTSAAVEDHDAFAAVAAKPNHVGPNLQ